MQYQDEMSISSFSNVLPVTPVCDFLSVDNEKQKQEFINSDKSSIVDSGCVSQLFLDYYSPLLDIPLCAGEDITYDVNVKPVMSNDDVVAVINRQYCASMEMETIDIYLEQINSDDSDDWVNNEYVM